MSDQLDFKDLSVVEERFALFGKQYLIREATEDAAVKYQNARIKAAKFSPDGKAMGFDGAADVEPLLVSLCTFCLVSDGKGGEKEAPLVPGEVRKWPARVVKRIYERVRKISDLEDVADTEQGLEQQITQLTERLEAMRAKRTEDALKNPHTADTTDTSS